MPDTISFPCRPELVGTARSVARALLADTPAADDAELVISEFVTNSIRWSASGVDNGTIHLRIEYEPGSTSARIEVEDGGRRVDPADVDQEDADQHGRGLLLVSKVAKDWGHRSGRGRGVYWAVLSWT